MNRSYKSAAEKRAILDAIELINEGRGLINKGIQKLPSTFYSGDPVSDKKTKKLSSQASNLVIDSQRKLAQVVSFLKELYQIVKAD